MAYKPPTERVRAIMRSLGDARMYRGHSWRAMATIMEDNGYRITEDQYRAAEQGITKKVTLDFLLNACDALDLDPAELITNGLKAAEE